MKTVIEHATILNLLDIP